MIEPGFYNHGYQFRHNYVRAVRTASVAMCTAVMAAGAALAASGLKTAADPQYTEDQAEEEPASPYYVYDSDDAALLSAYKEYNSDVVGLIRIDGSVLNHPLVQTPEDEEYYLYRDLDGEYNSHGVPFLSAESEMEGGAAKNMVVYGHNIHKLTRDAFADLAYYEDVEYYRDHAIIETVSESGTRRWLIFAYFITDNSEESAFRYSDFTEFVSEAELGEFLGEVSERNWLDVDVEAGMDDRLITLSSCSLELAGSGTNRMVVVGKLMRTDEECSEIIENAKAAEAPLLPDALTG